MAIWGSLGQFWAVARKVDDLLQLQTKTRAALDAVDTRLRALEDRMTRLEANQDRLITEAKAAAGVAAVGLAGATISDVVTRVTRLEERHENLRRSLPPPDRA